MFFSKDKTANSFPALYACDQELRVGVAAMFAKEIFLSGINL